MDKPFYPFPHAVVFDWDNTLIDSFPTIYKAMSEMLSHYKMPVPSYEEYTGHLGLSLRDTFPEMFGDKWEEARDIYLTAFQKYHLETLTPFDGVLELLKFIKERIGCCFVVSNKTGFILRKEVEHLGWEGFFDAVCGATDCAKDKPAPDPVYACFEKAGIEMKDGKPSVPVWFVGDGDADILCARNSGCLPVRIAEENKDGAEVLTLKNCREVLSELYSCTGTR